ncbi:PPE domain-containing protein [Actinophytocola sp.]|uniref:PPE domain-containing protein n=1 Tax=Actinophytocola sp. TaxID=1872138 RepID=UPI002D7E1B12|nr:PPE domain-containing protein [Actinophytocola sp.]HET9143229.1 PPE domain-containing protein [Actinophytocola sp.]
MGIWEQILGQNWAFYSHQRLYDMVRTEAAGVSAVNEADRTWGEFTDVMGQSRDNIDRLLNEAGATWQGLASESMQSGMTPLMQWTDDARTSATASNGSVQQVSEAFSFASNAMPEPVAVTSTANSDFGGIPASFTHLFGGQTDQDRQERAAQQAKQRAVELMQGYSSNAETAASSVGTFVPPQRVTVAVPPPKTTDTSVTATSDTIFTGPGRRPTGTAGPNPAPGSAPRVPAGSDTPNPGGTVTPPTGQPVQTTTPGSANPITELPGTAPQTPGEGPPSRGPGTGPPGTGFDPVTGHPLDPRTGLRIDPRTGLPIDPRTGLPVDPKTGRLIDPATGRPVGTGPGPADGGRGSSGSPGSGGRADGEPARGGRGGFSGGVPGEGERTVGARGGAGAAGRAAGSGAMAPMGGGAGTRGEEDEEHYSPDYLRGYHDEFWDDIPLVAPPVIGAEMPDDGTGTTGEGGGGGAH